MHVVAVMELLQKLAEAGGAALDMAQGATDAQVRQAQACSGIGLCMIDQCAPSHHFIGCTGFGRDLIPCSLGRVCQAGSVA